MFGLGKHGPDGRYGAIIDVGSGSVGVAIVASDPTKKHPEIIWTHRERMIIRDVDGLEESAKYITTALLNTILSLAGDGAKTLSAHEKGAKIETIQVAIAAPWSYTITKTVSFIQDNEFTITNHLVMDLVKTAQKQALEAIDENDIIKKLGLEMITRATINVSANNYTSEDIIGQKAKSISISHVSAISQKRLIDAIREGKDKVLPKADIESYSFMLIFYCVMQRLAPDTTEICLIDITSEATEIGVVRDGILKYCTHAPFGLFTLAREIADTCGIPKEEALGYLRGNTALEDTLSVAKQTALKDVLTGYERNIAELFKRTGDTLSIPRSLFIHTESRTENFFSQHFKRAATSASKSDHGIHLVTEALTGDTPINDSALLLSAHFFHKMHECDTFEQV